MRPRLCRLIARHETTVTDLHALLGAALQGGGAKATAAPPLARPTVAPPSASMPWPSTQARRSGNRPTDRNEVTVKDVSRAADCWHRARGSVECMIVANDANGQRRLYYPLTVKKTRARRPSPAETACRAHLSGWIPGRGNLPRQD